MGIGRMKHLIFTELKGYSARKQDLKAKEKKLCLKWTAKLKTECLQELRKYAQEMV